MPKGDSSKKKKADKDGGPSNSKKMKVDKQQRQAAASNEITMTIPRKKDAKNKAAASEAPITKELPKIPKKSDKQQSSATSSPAPDIIMGTIPKKNKSGKQATSTTPPPNQQQSQNKEGEDNKPTGKAERRESMSASSKKEDSSKAKKEDAKAKYQINDIIPKKSNNSKVDKKSEKQSGGKSEKQSSGSNGKPDSKQTKAEKRGSIKGEKQQQSNEPADNKTSRSSSEPAVARKDSATPPKTTDKSEGKTKEPAANDAPPKKDNRAEKDKVKADKSAKTEKDIEADQTPKKPETEGAEGTRSLKIDTSVVSATTTEPPSTKGKPPMTPSSGTAMDTHPFARGSVIEVLHGVSDPSGDSWWSDNSDEEEKEETTQSVRLCDIIDRVSTEDNKWKYYVHYRDFNRRMDEWIPMERIVSPPSVGNAKARAIKKEEERQKRKQQRLEEKKAEMNQGATGPRASRRRSSVMQTPTAGLDPVASPAEGEADTPRRTRLQRRKSTDDDGTVVASNQGDKSRGGDGGEGPPPVVMAAEKGVVAIHTQAATHTTVGEHVVATIPAQELDEHEGLDEASLREHEEVTKVKNVEFLELGAFQMETWYFSPLPKELLSEKGLIDVLYVCEFTFSMFSRKSELRRFQSRLKPHMRHPPGNEIYRNGNIAMFEVDGFEQRIYCQNLCYIAKLFLDHKTLYFDVDPFLFYVLCEVDERGFHPVGYYSKEKYSDVGYNLACILTFPCHQRKGYGRFLIAFSYELSKKEEKVGSPEKPMSDLGQQAYKPYWASTIVDFLLNQSPDSSSMSIMDISKQTSIMAEDIVFTLNQLGILKIINGVYFIAAEAGLLKTLAKKYPVKKPIVDPSKLHWTPFVTDVKRDKFSIHSKKASVESDDTRDKSEAGQK